MIIDIMIKIIISVFFLVILYFVCQLFQKLPNDFVITVNIIIIKNQKLIINHLDFLLKKVRFIIFIHPRLILNNNLCLIIYYLFYHHQYFAEKSLIPLIVLIFILAVAYLILFQKQQQKKIIIINFIVIIFVELFINYYLIFKEMIN